MGSDKRLRNSYVQSQYLGIVVINTDKIYYRQKGPRITTRIISVSNMIKEKDRKLLRTGKLVYMTDIKKTRNKVSRMVPNLEKSFA